MGNMRPRYQIQPDKDSDRAHSMPLKNVNKGIEPGLNSIFMNLTAFSIDKHLTYLQPYIQCQSNEYINK